MKDIRQTLLDRVTVRRYERETIPTETMDLIYRAIQNTPTSYNGQQFSVIDISDQELKEQLYDITGQKQIKTCNRFLVFCADYHKIAKLAVRKSLNMPDFTNTMDGITVGIIDASLAMMSAVVAAEAAGLGANCIGYLRTVDPPKVAKMLGLPQGVFVVCGLCLGIPREHPDLKPKQSLDLVMHQNRYRSDENAMTDELLQYDEIITQYNKVRSGATSENDWCDHILDYYRHAMNYRILDYLRLQGFDPKV